MAATRPARQATKPAGLLLFGRQFFLVVAVSPTPGQFAVGRELARFGPDFQIRPQGTAVEQVVERIGGHQAAVAISTAALHARAASARSPRSQRSTTIRHAASNSGAAAISRALA